MRVEIHADRPGRAFRVNARNVDEPSKARHNAVVLRPALAAVLLAAVLHGWSTDAAARTHEGDDPTATVTAVATRGCAGFDGGAQWNPQPDPATSPSQSLGKKRSVNAAFPVAASLRAPTALAASASPQPRAPDSPPHIRHTPLLI